MRSSCKTGWMDECVYVCYITCRSLASASQEDQTGSSRSYPTARTKCSRQGKRKWKVHKEAVHTVLNAGCVNEHDAKGVDE
eukprot:350327-Chlamydomonas_euryale.AAC.2